MAASLVRVEASIPHDATTAGVLGRERMGSGVIIGPDVVLTIGYLVLEADDIQILTPRGRRIPASVAGYDHATGFGLVRTVLPLQSAPLELGDSDIIDERSKVFTIGQSEAGTTELVVVSRKPFSGSWEYLLERPIYTFPPVNNWSGSALLDTQGRLVGIGSLIVRDAATDRAGVPGNLFVPVNLLKPILTELLDRGQRSGPAQPWLGISTESVRGNLMVTRVAKGGPAEGAGIGPGDIVIGVGEVPVSDQADFYRRVWELGPAGTAIPIRLLQQGTLRTVVVQSVDRADYLRKPAGV
ncbi:MAG: serine protease [Burkholderiales bacterium]|nr:MAG: serine protease [Burkholderiales bacterium]